MIIKTKKDMSSTENEEESAWSSGMSVRTMALESVVNVNGLFTLALFLGLSWFPIASLTGDPDCPSAAAVLSLTRGLVSCHVYSFASFLFSTLVASALKQAIRSGPRLGRPALRLGTLVSGLASAAGCGFLTAALADLVRIKLGDVGCGGGGFYAGAALAPLLVLVPLGLLLYLSLGLHAFTR